MTESKTPKRVKIAPNLYKVGEVYRYRRGDFEKVLGQFKSDKEAIKEKERFELVRSQVGPESFTIRMKAAWPDYIEERERQAEGELKNRKRISTGTLREIKYIWDLHLLKFWGNKRFSDVDHQRWEEYVAQASVSDLKNHRKVFSGFLRWANKRGFIRYVPTFDVPPVLVRKRVILTPDQIKALITNAASDNALLFIAMYLFMGMRRGEQVHLKWSDIDFGLNHLQVRDETTRTRKGRPVPINAYVRQLLLRRQDSQRAVGVRTPYVFPLRGDPSRHMRHDGIFKTWHTTLRRAKLEGIIEPHDLRATFEFYANKRSDFTDMQREKFAGASIKIQSQRYVNFGADDVRGLEESVQFLGLEAALENTLLHPSSRKSDGKKTGRRPNLDPVDNSNSGKKTK